MKTDTELRKLAMDIYTGTVFTSASMHPRDLKILNQVFMPLFMMNKEDFNNLMEQKPVLFYEHIDQCIGRYINGYPILKSCRYLVQEEADIVQKYLDQLNAFRDGSDVIEKEVEV